MSSTRRTGGSKASKAKEREGTPKIFEGVEKYTFSASIAAIDREDRDQIQDFALNLSEGWKFGMWNQRGVETTHATNLAERGFVVNGSKTRWRRTLEGKRIQDIPVLELTSEGKKALARGEFRPFGGNHRRSAIEILVKTAKAELDRAMDAAQRAQLEELTKTIGWLKGEMKWNHLWHLNVWDLDQLRSTSYPEDIIFAHLSRNTNKYVYLETESERVLLDIQEVRSALKRDDDIWASQIASTGDIKDLELSMHQTNFVRELKVYGKRQTQVKGRQNSTTNSFIYSRYAVRMMCRYAHCGSHYFNGHYRSLKGMRVLLEGHLSGIFSTLFDINHRILMVAGSPHPFGTAADKKEVSTPSEHKRGHHSPAWKRTYVSMCQNMGDPSWLGQMMGMFDVAFKNAFCGDQGVMKDFLTKSKQYLEAFREYMSEVQEIIRRQITAQGLGVEYQNACVRLEWLLRHWPYGDEIPVPLLSNTMLEWMEERMKPVSDGIVEIGAWFDPLAWYNSEHSHAKTKVRDMSSALFDAILQDPLITKRIHDATEAVAAYLLFNSFGALVDLTRSVRSLHERSGARPPASIIKSIPTPGLRSRGKAKAKAVDAEESYPFFGSLDPPVHEEVIDRAWSSLKAAWDDSKTALRSSDDTEKRMIAVTAIPDTKDRSFPQMALLVERHFLLVALYTDQRTFPFWDLLDPSPPDSSSLLSPAEIDRLSALESDLSEGRKFNQKILSLVERSKFTHLNFDPKTNLSGGIKNALDSLLWNVSAAPSIPPSRQKSSQRPILHKQDVSRASYSRFSAVSAPLPPPPTRPTSSPPPQSRPAPSSSRPRRPSVRIQSKPFINQDDDSDNDDQSDDDDKGATTTDAPSEGFDLEHPEGDNDDDATDEDVPHPPLLPPQSQSDQDDDEDDPNLRTPIPLQRSSQPRSARRIDSPRPSPSPVPSRNSPHILVPDSQPPRLSLGPRDPALPPSSLSLPFHPHIPLPPRCPHQHPLLLPPPIPLSPTLVAVPSFRRSFSCHSFLGKGDCLLLLSHPRTLEKYRLVSRVVSRDDPGNRHTHYTTSSIVFILYTSPGSPPLLSFSFYRLFTLLSLSSRYPPYARLSPSLLTLL
ncbi:hypothetical protein BS47DRAFT_1391884 [Hydnum rufescens UP504]|uniref:Uncharacterized protein n=1 Tax=Hydnum rufescens UP504 TaxID=1448309 RepID=A0A9P6DXR8_9AGAM|nr:hypothetical protein BS47DRAFT_1391884 [Hydnum rufescens UP504]